MALETIAHGDGRVDLERLKPIHRRLRKCDGAKARRALGDPDHAAPRTDRESPPVALRITAGRTDRDLAEVWAAV